MRPPAMARNLNESGSLVRRASLLLCGSVVATICYALTIRANLGLGPLFVLQDGAAKRLGITIGTSVILIGFVLLLVALALRSSVGPGTFVLPVVGGLTLDALLPDVPTLHGWLLRMACVVMATWVMALGGAMMIRASVGVTAYDAVMLGLRRITRRPLAPIRLAMEGTVLAVGWALGGAVGVGTVLTGILIGPGIQFWLGILHGPAIVPVTED